MHTDLIAANATKTARGRYITNIKNKYILQKRRSKAIKDSQSKKPNSTARHSAEQAAGALEVPTCRAVPEDENLSPAPLVNFLRV